jgi:hypothetical protein
MTVRKIGSKYVLYTKDGSQRLGTHDSKEEAEAQEHAIQISKARAAGHHIPKEKP